MLRLSLLAAAMVTGLAAVAAAQGAPPGIAVTNAWARATPKGAVTGAAYVTVANQGTSDDRLLGVSTPVAKVAQLHTTINDHGILKMRPLASVDMKPGASVSLKPGGMHVMLMGLKQPLTEGEKFPLTLNFATAGKIETMVTVAKAGAMNGMDMGGGSGMKMEGMSGKDMPQK
jgi:hypothetical protein